MNILEFCLFCCLSILTVPSWSGVPAERIRLTIRNTTLGPERGTGAFVTAIGRDGAGRICRLEADGQFQPCTAPNLAKGEDGRIQGLPLAGTLSLDLDRRLRLRGGRIYLSFGAPLQLRLNADGGLVQPDPANPADPDAGLIYDWIEFTLDDTGFHGNPTCVDQFGLPVSLSLVDRRNPNRPLGPVGITQSRSALLQAWQDTVPEPFRGLADPAGRRILAPSHSPLFSTGAGRDCFGPWVQELWRRYRTEPLVLTPDQGRCSGRVAEDGRMLFVRDGDPASYALAGPPTTAEVLGCRGVLAQGNDLEKVLGAQLAAQLNRHVQDPLRWRDPAQYYLESPCNEYARFWHRHSVDGRVYGFPYDDVNDQAAFLECREPEEIIIELRLD
jgi:hypothetical protein